MEILRSITAVLVGFSSGLVVSGAVFAFITVIGAVPRMAHKTSTRPHVKIYESSIMLGGMFGVLNTIFRLYIPIGSIGVILLSVGNGIFVGVLAMSLAEVLDVIPILTRRGRIQHGMFFFVLAIAAGKLAGSLLYFLLPGFYDAGNM